MSVKNIYFLIIALLIAQSATAQLKVSIFEDSRAEKLGQVDQNLAEYRRIEKENRKFLKDQRRRYKTYKDSIANVSTERPSLDLSVDSLETLQKLQKEYFIFTDQWYSLEELHKMDDAKSQSQEQLLNYSKDKLTGNYYFDKYTRMNNQITAYRTELKEYKDSLKSTDMEKRKMDYLMILKKEELNKQYGADVSETIEKEVLQQTALNLPAGNPNLENALQFHDVAKTSLPKFNVSKATKVNYFKGHEQLLNDAMGETNKLKEKYSTVLNSEDLSTATERNSLKGKKFGERLMIGGTFQIRIDYSTTVDLNPEIQYLITKKWSAGVGGNYRFNSKIQDVSNAMHKQAVYGYRILTEYMLVSSFYAHAEFESLASKIQNTEQSTQWHNSFLVGIGRQFTLSGLLKGQVSLLYNFNHQSNPLYDNAWNVRFGFNIQGLKSKKD